MKKTGFTLIELMVVILIVGILAAASVPLMRGRINSAKWAEANAMAGTIQTAARVYFVEHGSISTDVSKTDLGFLDGDLEGTYFTENDFSISAVSEDDDGKVAVSVTGSKGNAPEGTWVLGIDGSWKESTE